MSLFFFFKQKTAYEMRISDWSSDVCSSDLPALEDLVHRRRLVDLAGDGHVVLDVERVGVEAAVPAHHVEGVGGVGQPGADDACAGAVLDQDLDRKSVV